MAADRSALTRLQDELAQQPGVTRVIGPSDLLMSRPRGVLISESGNAARYLLIYDTDPLGAQAIGHIRQLESNLPELVTQSGLSDAQVSIAGQTLFASEVAQLTRRSIEITVATALLIELVILILYLRALVAPIVLLGASALSVAAAEAVRVAAHVEQQLGALAVAPVAERAQRASSGATDAFAASGL